MRGTFSLAMAALMVGLSGSSVANAAVLYSDAADARPYYNTGIGFPPNVTLPVSGGDGVDTVTGDTIHAGNPFASQGSPVFVFQIPDYGIINNPFLSATFSATVSSVQNNTTLNFNGGNQFDLYGLPARASSTVLASDLYLGGNDGTAGVSKLQDDFATHGDNNPAPGTQYTTDAGGSSNLLAYLNAQYAGGAGVGTYAFLRGNADFVIGSFAGASFYSGEATDSAVRPAITFTADTSAIPEPASVGLIGASAVGLLARRRTRRA